MKKNPKLVFMSASGTVSPIYDFRILYEKLIPDFRIIVVEKFGYGYSDLYEGPFILLPHSMSGLEAIRWAQLYPEEVEAIIGLDMATPQTYKEWSSDQVAKRIRLM